jgi:hypothetical protein
MVYGSILVIICLVSVSGMSSSVLKSPCRVAIIGAGASGLIAAKALSFVSDPHHDLDICVFEKADHIGGVWKYKSKPSVSASDNPMYKSLRTNLPVEIMSYCEDIPFLPNAASSSYLSHEEVQQYLENFADKYDLFRYISFKTEVIRLEKNPSRQQWLIETMSSGTSSSSSTSLNNKDCFDHVIVCNGHFSRPYVPKVEGIERFKGHAMHSCMYDSNDDFLGLRVLIVGTKSSGTDIAYEVSSVAKMVYVSDRQRSTMTSAPSNSKIVLCPDIAHVDAAGAVAFIDGSKIEVDRIIWCTGYEYSYPFIEPSPLSSMDEDTMIPSSISIAGGRAVLPLYKQLFYARDPTLSFIGLPYSVIPFPLMHLQACWIAACITGKCSLPTADELYTSFLDDWKERKRQQGLGLGKLRMYHYLGDYLQFDYMRFMAKQASLLDDRMSRYLSMVEAIYYDNSANKPIFPGAVPDYRNRRYTINW